MAEDTQTVNLQDERWSGYVPWFLRHQEFSAHGDFKQFFRRVAQRLQRLFRFNEPGLPNLPYFGSVLESESLQRFTYNPASGTLDTRINEFFSWSALEFDVNVRLNGDPESRRVTKLVGELHREQNKAILSLGSDSLGASMPGGYDKAKEEAIKLELFKAEIDDKLTRKDRFDRHLPEVIKERVGVLEALFHILPENDSRSSLISDIRKFFAEAHIPLDFRGDPPLILPLDEPLLQKQVIDRLLLRLHSGYPEVASGLINAYHAVVQGADANSVFGGAYKALEKLAKQLSGQESLLLSSKEDVSRYFPGFHATTYANINKLAAHAGDEGRHGGKGPTPFEIRYLLFEICNTALLLLDRADFQKGSHA